MLGRHRPRLVLTRARLDELVRGKQIVILEGPSGCGKTTFGEQLLTTAELARTRIRLTRQADGAGLLDAMVRAFRRAGLSDLASTVDGSPDDGIDRLLAALSRRADPVVMMIDEAQLLTEDGIATLAELANELPAHCRLIVAGRRVPARRFGSPSDTVVIDAGPLRFDHDEVAEILGAHADDDLVADVARITDRWPAAVALAAAILDSDPSWSPGTAVGERRIVETLLDQLLSPLPAEARVALSTLAHFPLIDAAIIERVGASHIGQLLVDIGLPLQHAGRWSVIPDAIRDCLRGERPDKSLIEWVAEHYADTGELAVAVSLLTADGHSAAVAKILSGLHWTELEALGLGTVRVLIDSIGDQLREYPGALLNAVWASDRRDHVLKMAWVNSGLSVVADGPARRALQAEEAIELARHGDMAAAEAQALCTLTTTASDEGVTRGRAHLAVGMAHAFRATPAELSLAEGAFDDAIALFRLAGENRWEAYALERSAYLVAFKRGAFSRSAEQLEQALTLSTAESRDRLTTLTSYADVLYRLDRGDEARAAANEALNIGRRWADPLAIGFAAWTLAWIAAYDEDAEATHAALKLVDDHPGPWLDQYTGHEFLVDAAWMMTLVDDPEGLRCYKDRAEHHVHRNDQLLGLLNARLDAIDGDPQRALTMLADLEGTAYADPGLAWQRSLIIAVAQLRDGHVDRATDFARQTTRATEQLGLPDLADRLERRLVRMLAPVWPRNGQRAAKIATHLSMFGGFSLRRGGEDCTPAVGNSATLVKLLALRGELVADQLIDMLWPDADASTGRARLRNLLNRVRSQCGDIVVRRGDSFCLYADVVIDTAEFEHAAADVFRSTPDRRAGAARLVLATHAGELLPGDTYEDWAAAPRERFKRRMLSLVDIVIDDSFEHGDMDDAVRWLDVAIAVEPLEESRYVRACEALLVQGRRATAREVGERAMTMLADLGVSPSHQLQSIVASVDGG